MKTQSKSTPLILEYASEWMLNFWHHYRLPFCSSFLFGLLAYGYTFTNKLINHDEASSLFTKGATVTSGRWGLGALDSIFPNYSMPWIYGLMTVLFISLCVCLLISIFDIKKQLLQVLLSGSILVFPSLIGLFGYMFTSSSFALSFLLSVISVALVQRLQKWRIPFALAALVLSLSIYQSYISVAASLLVLILIQQLIRGEKSGTILIRGICYVLFLVTALALYYLGTQVVLRLTGTVLNTYASEKIALSVSSILQGSALAYTNFLQFFTMSFLGLIPTAFSRTLHGILAFSLIALLLPQLFVIVRKQIDAAILLVLLAAVFPLAINCMYLITTPDSIHTLVLFSFISVYILAVVLADFYLERYDSSRISWIVLNILTTVMALIIVVNIYVANQASLHLQLRYENASAFYTSLIADIKLTPGFDENTKLAIIGDYQQPEYYVNQFEHIHGITGVYGFVPDSYSKNYFMEYYSGFPIAFASDQEIQQILSAPEFDAMAVYPYYGSLQKIGDILVVKLS